MGGLSKEGTLRHQWLAECVPDFRHSFGFMCLLTQHGRVCRPLRSRLLTQLLQNDVKVFCTTINLGVRRARNML
jgi:hypothetical protein